MKNLTSSVFSGFFWMTFNKIGNVILHLIILAILARLLTPKDFGMLAAAMVVINFSDIFAQIGVGPSIIIKDHINENYIRTAFTLSIILGFSFFLLLFVFARQISFAFRIDELSRVLMALSIIFPLRSFSVVAESLLKKNLRFKILAFRGLISYTLGYGIIGITMAALGYGIWALVSATLSQVFTNTLFVLIAYPHKKRLLFRKDIAKELLFYGGGFTLSRVFSYTANQADNFVVARWLGSSALGFYNRAYTLMKTPINLYGQMLHDVLFPALAGVKDKSAQMTSVFSKGTVLLSIFSMPLMLLMIVLAPEIIHVFLGSQWDQAIEPFQIIALSMYFRVGYRISVTITKSAGVIYKNAYLQFIYTVLIIIAAFIGKKWGINGVSTGVTIAIFIQFLLMSNLGLSITTIKWRDFIKLHYPALIFTAILTPFIILITYYTRYHNMHGIIVIISNFGVFIIITFLLYKLNMHIYLGDDFIDVFKKFKTLIYSKKNNLQKNNKSFKEINGD